MPDAAGLVKMMKKAAMEAVEEGRPVQICCGKVIQTAPLKIQVEQKMILGEAQLILPRSITDYKLVITGGNVQDYSVDDTGTTAPVAPPHKHAAGTMEITVHNGLVVDDFVLLLRQQGGQKYIVLDRIG